MPRRRASNKETFTDADLDIVNGLTDLLTEFVTWKAKTAQYETEMHCGRGDEWIRRRQIDELKRDFWELGLPHKINRIWDGLTSCERIVIQLVLGCDIYTYNTPSGKKIVIKSYRAEEEINVTKLFD